MTPRLGYFQNFTPAGNLQLIDESETIQRIHIRSAWIRLDRHLVTDGFADGGRRRLVEPFQHQPSKLIPG